MGSACHAGDNVSNGYDLKYFEAKYGKQEMMEILKWNVRKDQILNKMPEISERYRKIIHNHKIESVRQLNILQAHLYDEMEIKIKHIEKNDTGEVTKAEAHYDMCAEELMGRKQIEQDCSKLRKKIHQVYEAEQKSTRETIETNFQTYVKNLEQQKRAKFSEIGQLTEQNRECIRRQMRKEFKRQIKRYREDVHKQISEGKICDMVHLKQDYNHLHPKEEIQKIKVKGEKLIKEGQQKIIGIEIFGMNSKQILPSPGFWGCCGRA